MISQALGQFGKTRQADMEKQALSQLLSGRAAQAGPGLEALTSKGAPGLDPSLAGPSLGMTQPGGMAQPRIPGLLEGGQLTPEMGRAFMEAGGDPFTLARLMPQQGEGFSLSPGQVRYDAQGRQVAQAPGEAPDPTMLSGT